MNNTGTMDGTPSHSPASLIATSASEDTSGAALASAASVAASSGTKRAPKRSRSRSHSHSPRGAPRRMLINVHAPSMEAAAAASAASAAGTTDAAVVASSPSASPSPVASPIAGSGWSKPSFLSKLHVHIPELSPLISSPIACGSTPTSTTAARLPSLPPAQPVPAPPVDGVVSNGPHYAISLLKGRRRHMEDMYLQATIDFAAAAASTAATAAAPAQPNCDGVDAPVPAATLSPTRIVSASPAPPPCNFFGCADGHGKGGAQVAQLTAHLLPSLLAEQLARLRQSPPFAITPPALPTSAVVPVTSLLAQECANRAQSPPTSSTALASMRRGVSIDAQFKVPPMDGCDGVPPSTADGITVSASPVLTSTHPGLSHPKESDADVPTDSISLALQEAYLALDAKVIAGSYSGGTTCTTALIHAPTPMHTQTDDSANISASPSNDSPQSATAYIAHVGDSRCVLSRAGTAVALTSDHKPDRADERARIESAGGHVVYVSGWRVDGVLNISRAIGDAHLKDPLHPTRGRVIARPEVTKHRVDAEDEFLILASDGIWGRVDNQTAVDIVRRVLTGQPSKTEAAPYDAATADAKSTLPLEQTSPTFDEGDVDERPDLLPRHPSLTHEHSYIEPTPAPSPDATPKPRPSNPIATPRHVAASVPPTPAYNRMGSVETVRSVAATPRPGAGVGAHFAAGLNTDGTLGSHVGVVSLFSPRPSTASSSHLLLSPFDTPRTTASSRTVLSSASGLSSGASSTQLSTPLGTLSVMPLVSPAAAAQDGFTVPATELKPIDTSAVIADGGATAAPFDWSSFASADLSQRIAEASEALVRHAYEEANSMDNISVAIVLLHPFQQQHVQQPTKANADASAP